ncbi:porin [Inquilinus limosus]|uniref:porin n=1 Tax=Inquilinus limosus TaxID=171674 RepID=UPI003F153902
MDRDHDFASGARLQVEVENVTDGGLEYGAGIRMFGVDRQKDVRVDRAFLYLSGGFGRIDVGDTPSVGEDLSYVFAHDALISKLGVASHWDDNIDGRYLLGGGNFFSLDPSYLAGLGADTRIKYTSPTLSGFTAAVDFAPVVGGDAHAGPGGRSDLADDNATVYENVASAGLSYSGTFDKVSVLLSGAVARGNGVRSAGNPKGNDLAFYSLGGQVGYGDVTASVDWIHNESIAAADRAVDTITGDVSYRFDRFLVSVAYSYTLSPRGNGLASSMTNGVDLKDNSIAGLTLVYHVASGLNTYAELMYEQQNFRSGSSWDSASIGTGLVVNF